MCTFCVRGKTAIEIERQKEKDRKNMKIDQLCIFLFMMTHFQMVLLFNEWIYAYAKAICLIKTKSRHSGRIIFIRAIIYIHISNRYGALYILVWEEYTRTHIYISIFSIIWAKALYWNWRCNSTYIRLSHLMLAANVHGKFRLYFYGYGMNGLYINLYIYYSIIIYIGMSRRKLVRPIFLLHIFL